MKKLFVAIVLFVSISARAQQNTLLDQSFWQGTPNLETVKAEIAKGNKPFQFNAMSMDPVVMAINAQAPTEIIKYLLAQPGVDVNKLTHDGRTYLHWAANRGNAELVEYLLSKGAKINIEDSHGSTPLLFAASSGQQNTKVYDVLIAHGVNLKKNVNGDGANVLLLAIANDKDFKLTDYFVSKGLDIKSTDAAGNNAFSYAAKSGNIEILKFLLQKGVLVNQYAMLMAAQGGGRRGGGGATLAFYQYLESLGIKPTATAKNGENILHYLVRKQGQNEIIQYFLARGIDVNQTDDEGYTVLMDAASGNRDTSVMALLLPKVKNINQANQEGLTALTLAVRSNSPEMVSYLIAKDAAVNVLNKKGNNLAYYAIESYRPQTNRGGQGLGGTMGQGGQGQDKSAGNGQGANVAQDGQGGRSNSTNADDFNTKLTILKQKGLDIAAPQQNGNTLYHLAIAKNDISFIKRLQPLGIDINAKNKEGMTALHKAALIAKDDTMLKYLLSIGATKDAVTDFNETAFELASQNETLTKNNVSVNFLK